MAAARDARGQRGDGVINRDGGRAGGGLRNILRRTVITTGSVQCSGEACREPCRLRWYQYRQVDQQA